MNFAPALRLVLAAALFSATAQLHAATTNTNTLAIFLIDAPQAALNGKTFEPSSIKLAEKPLLADRDFVRYDKQNHTFSITADSARRMAKQLDPKITPNTLADGTRAFLLSANDEWRGRPFALLAERQIIYIGCFYNRFSSFSPYPLPTISLPTTVPLDSQDPITFEITPHKDPTAESKDVRSDPRIARALERLGL